MPRQIDRTPKDVNRFQVVVKAKDPESGLWKDLRIGPMLQGEAKNVLEEHAATINKAVAEGREKTWCDARVIQVDKIEVVH